MQSSLWTDKFFPSSFEEFIGNTEIVDFVKKWSSAWNSGEKQKPLLFHGHSGAGKTCLAILTAQLNGWDLFELNASDFRTKDIIEKVAGSASQFSSFSGKRRLVLIDEVDGIQGRSDSGGGAALVKIMKEARQPIILTANDLYPQGSLRNTFAALRASSETLQFKKINYLSIAKRLRELLGTGQIVYDEDAVKELAKDSGGDFRAALLDTQSLAVSKSISIDSVASLGFREREEDIFKTMGKIFRAKTFKEAREARFKSDLDAGMLSKWFEENIPIEFSEQEDIARAFDMLSRADRFEGRIVTVLNYPLLVFHFLVLASTLVGLDTSFRAF